MPIKPSDTITLAVNGTYYSPTPSHMDGPPPAGTLDYAHAGSTNPGTNYGAAQENHEAAGGAYNDIKQTVSASPSDSPGIR